MNRIGSEKFRSEFFRNPFKFGGIVDGPYFTNRKRELREIRSILESQVHLIIMSPRRYGKTSLILKAVKELRRPVLFCDLQVITSELDFAEQLLKKIHKIFPLEKIKNYLKTFRIIPSFTINPLSNEVNVTFNTSVDDTSPLEDVLNLCQQLSQPGKRMIVIFDEFQEIRKIAPRLENKLRAVMQHHNQVNYVFLGSQESLIRDIFENRKTPFYHFGRLFVLSKIPQEEFKDFLVANFNKLSVDSLKIADEILNATDAHPYFTQQLAFYVWEMLTIDGGTESPVKKAQAKILTMHSIDYERIWNTFNRTDMKIMIGLATSPMPPLSEEFRTTFKTGSSSTTYSGLSRLIAQGFVLQSEKGYAIEDPFFKQWIIERRSA